MSRRIYYVRQCFLSLSLLLIFSPTLLGVTLTWDGSVGNWDNDASWLPDATEPTSADAVLITDGQVDVTIAGEEASGVAVSGGSLNISNSGTLDSYLGSAVGSTGSAYVTGAGSTWNSAGDLNVNGMLNVKAGGTVTNYNGIVYGSGVATVTGVGSRWICSGDLKMSGNPDSELWIKDSGVVHVMQDTLVGALYGGAGAPGRINFANGTLATTGLITSPHNLLGTGTIHTRSLVSDIDLVFNASTGLQQQINLFNLTGHLITIDLDASDPSSNGTFGAGFRDTSALTIAQGISLASKGGLLGARVGSIGLATVTGADSAWINSGELCVGKYGSGTLNVEAGGLITNTTGRIGSSTGSTGVVTVTGMGSMWTNSGHLIVGDFGDGTLNVEDGGTVTNSLGIIGDGYNSGSMGVATVTGEGSTWTNTENLYVGWTGEGRLNVENGGTVHVMQDTFVNSDYNTENGSINFAGGTLDTNGLSASPDDLLGIGTINTRGLVSDIDLVFDVSSGTQQQIVLDSLPGQNVTINLDTSDPVNGGRLGAGYLDLGSLTIAEGAYVSSGSGDLGQQDGSTGIATVTGLGSTWFSSGPLRVGVAGVGVLTIQDGGSVISTTGDISAGYLTYLTSEVTVTGAGSTWSNSGDLLVGHWGYGTLLIQDGGAVSNTDGYIGHSTMGPCVATVTGAGSIWTSTGDLYVGYGSGSGTLNVLDNGLVEVAGTLTVWSSSTVQGNGNITATNMINDGLVALGNSIGILTLTGDYTQDTYGKLIIEVGGESGVDYQVVNIGGEATLNGSLQLSLLNTGSLPNFGETYTVLTANSVTGSFAQLEHQIISGDRGFSVTYPDSQSVVLEVVAMSFLAGDLNGDGIVGIEDLNMILGRWNQNVTANAWPLGDPSGDGFVGIEDLNAVLGNWNASMPPVDSSIIPEPAAITMFFAMSLAIGGRTSTRITTRIAS
jgi:fibronectin-binding autotransporter adhesin